MKTETQHQKHGQQAIVETSRDVFALRRAARLDEAVALGSRLFEGNRSDEWNVKALAWSLYSRMKTSQDHDSRIADAKAFMALPLPENDEYLSKVAEIVRNVADPVHDRMRELSERSKAGDEVQAVEEMLRLTREPDFDEYMINTYGWALGRWLLHADAERLNTSLLYRPLGEYRRLRAVPEASDLHSVLLKGLLRVKKCFSDWVDIAAWWNVENLQEQDWEVYVYPDGRRVASVAERLLGVICKAVKEKPAALADADWVLTYAGKVFERCRGSRFAAYYYGVLLGKAGRNKEAQVVLRRFLQWNRKKSWAWSALAEVCDANDDRMACLARAVLCGLREEKTLVSVYQDLVGLLRDAGMFAEASVVLDRLVHVRRQNGWSLPGEVEQWLKQDWYMADHNGPELKKVCRDLSASSDRMIQEGKRKSKGVPRRHADQNVQREPAGKR